MRSIWASKNENAPARSGMSSRRAGALPAVSGSFWFNRVVVAISGEIAGQLLYQLYLHRSGRLIVALALWFFLTLAWRASAREFSRATFWSALFGLSILSAVLARTIDNGLGIGDVGAVLHTFALLVLSLVICYRMTRASAALTNRTGHEAYFWAIAAASQTLGSGLADWMLERSASGYVSGLTAVALGLSVIIGLALFTRVSPAALFWTAFVLTGTGASLGGHIAAKAVVTIGCSGGSNCRSGLMYPGVQQWGGLPVVRHSRKESAGAFA